MTTDPIADILTRIKNAYMAKHSSLIVPHSRIKAALVEILIKTGYLKSSKVEGKKPHLNLNITLKYTNKTASLTDLKRISKPGVRHYANAQKLKSFKGRGIVILSTSQGLMTAKDAQKLKIGGEIICKVN